MSIAHLLHDGVFAARNREHARARSLLAQAVRTDRRCAEAWYWLSTVLDDLGQIQDCLERVLQIEPTHPKALERLETLRVMQLLQTPTPVLDKQTQAAVERLGDWLCARGILSQAQLAEALATQRQQSPAQREPLGAILLRKQFIQPQHLKQALEAQLRASLHRANADSISRLGQHLVRGGHLSAEQLAHCIVLQTQLALKGRQIRLGELLVREGTISQQALGEALHAQQLEYHHLFRG